MMLFVSGRRVAEKYLYKKAVGLIDMVTPDLIRYAPKTK